jgi:dolichol-phosphate mannosyltransferase
MTDEVVAVERAGGAQQLHSRVRAGMRRPDAWWQLMRFGLVGASGYVVNLAVFTLCVEVADVQYRLAATVAFLVAVTNNFLWHRHWTFRAGHGRRRHQAPRFLIVSVAAFLVGLGVLTALIELAGVPEVPAQAIAIVAVTPLSFVANKLWTFGR